MVLSEEGMNRAKELARTIVRVNKIQEIENHRLAREKQVKAMQESMESLGRTIRNAHDALIEGYVKPLVSVVQSIKNGYNK